VNKLLEIDQRQTWWENYGRASALGYTQLPTELDNGNLREITAQPLLNYLVAISYESKEVDFTENSNINEIYAHLLTKVYQRVWAKKNHNPHIQGIEEKDFIRILEGIAIAAWHGGDVRITTVADIEKYCDVNIIDRIVKTFKQDKRASFTRLLTAFYFRQHGVKNQEETFEFTHKSFGEYLAAKGIVRQLNLIHRQLKQKQEDTDYGWDEKQALENWAKVCGLTAIDEYIFEFIVNEIRWQQDKYNIDVSAWQQTLCNLISYMLKHGMPMERLGIGTFQEANRQARNAEEALLVVLNACARVTKEVSQIKWHSSVIEDTDEGEKEYFTDFGNWISRLRGQRVNYNRVFCLNCLSYLDLQNCILTAQDFFGANLQWANLQWANLQWANLQWANLQWANLQWANLESAKLESANLESAKLEFAKLKSAKLEFAKLESAKLEFANLQSAKLEFAKLKSANLQSANLQWANLQSANLQSAKLKSANLQLANLESANLESANLQLANLESANLQLANLESANLQLANLESANLQWAELQWAELQWAELQWAELQSANLEDAIVEWPRLLPANFEPEDSKLSDNPPES
jgi:uncharacterized protein YjbI with pentapeptide repeats